MAPALAASQDVCFYSMLCDGWAACELCSQVWSCCENGANAVACVAVGSLFSPEKVALLATHPKFAAYLKVCGALAVGCRLLAPFACCMLHSVALHCTHAMIGWQMMYRWRCVQDPAFAQKLQLMMTNPQALGSAAMQDPRLMEALSFMLTGKDSMFDADAAMAGAESAMNGDGDVPMPPASKPTSVPPQPKAAPPPAVRGLPFRPACDEE